MDAPGAPGESEHRREAAAHIERGIQKYAQGAFDEAVVAFEAALAIAPDNARAVECLAWAREVVAGRRTLTSGTYAALTEDELNAEPNTDPRAQPNAERRAEPNAELNAAPRAEPNAELNAAPRAGPNAELRPEPEEPAPLDLSPAAPLDLSASDALVPASELGSPRTGRTMLEMPSLGDAPPRELRSGDQLDDAPDSVTREWSTMRTGQNLPQLDVPELSEDQIANLLEGGGRGLTLSKGEPAPAPSEEDGEEADKTNVRLLERVPQVVEMVADSEDEGDDDNEPSIRVSPSLVELPSAYEAPADEFEPQLTPLSSPADAGADRRDQTGEEPSSMPTNPFVRQRLSEYASPLLTSAARVEDLPPGPAVPAPATTEPGPLRFAAIDAAIGRGALREAFELAERVEAMSGARTSEEVARLVKLYETMVGDLAAVPRFGKATPDLDSRSAFLLSRMDGSTSADDLLDVSGMPRNEALRLLARLVVTGVVTMRK